jgi:hypothetical protein
VVYELSGRGTLAPEKRENLALEGLEIAEAITDHSEDPLVVNVTVLVDENVARSSPT